MLVLTLPVGQIVRIGENIHIKLMSTGINRAHVAFDADPQIRIERIRDDGTLHMRTRLRPGRDDGPVDRQG